MNLLIFLWIFGLLLNYETTYSFYYTELEFELWKFFISFIIILEFVIFRHKNKLKLQQIFTTMLTSYRNIHLTRKIYLLCSKNNQTLCFLRKFNFCNLKFFLGNRKEAVMFSFRYFTLSWFYIVISNVYLSLKQK